MSNSKSQKLSESWDPLEISNADIGMFVAIQRRVIRNILKSYTGYYDLFSELIQNALDAVERPPSYAYIREDECIGCTKCIQACPMDAILGAAKQMHTVIRTECTGCDLCVEPCPVDCIEMRPIEKTLQTWSWDLPKPPAKGGNIIATDAKQGEAA